MPSYTLPGKQAYIEGKVAPTDEAILKLAKAAGKLEDRVNNSKDSNQILVSCPVCGSNHIASFNTTEPKYNSPVKATISDVRKLSDRLTGEAIPYTVLIKSALPDFKCQAGDCGYEGYARREQ